jgi:hypothetical protein
VIPGATFRAVTAVKRFARGESRGDACELCAVPLSEAHDHLLQPTERRLACACAACACLFPSAGTARYLRVRTRVRRIPGMALDDAALRALDVPVRLAFVAPSRLHARIFATYPNAGGATESVVPDAAWAELVTVFPVLADVEPELEGLLIDHIGGRTDCFIATIDVCHRVIGLLRGKSGTELPSVLAALAESSP